VALEIPDADEDFDHPALPESQPLRGTSFTGLLPLLIKGAAGSPPRPAALVFGVMDGDDLMAINMGEAITVERSQKKPSWTPMVS